MLSTRCVFVLVINFTLPRVIRKRVSKRHCWAQLGLWVCLSGTFLIPLLDMGRGILNMSGAVFEVPDCARTQKST